MSDNLSFNAYGGSSDNYYGTYGGTNQGPTSYNPWNIGGGGSSTYTSGPGVATPTGAADRVIGRVSPATQLRAVDKRGTHDIADGTAAQLLAQAQAIISVAASDNKDFAASNRAPNLYMPSVLNQTISFESGQQFIDYLSRSAEPLIPNAVLGSTAQSVLGRPMSNEEIGALQGAVNAGGTLSTVRWSLAHSAEAVARITDIYKSVLDRDPDAPSLMQAEDALGGTLSLQDVRVAAAHSTEETNRINAIYQQVLGRAVDGGALNLLENATAGGWSLRDVRWNVSHSAEAGTAVDTIYRQVLNRAIDGGSQTVWQDALGSGWALRDVRWNVSHSAEAGTAVDTIYRQVLNHAVDGSSRGFWLDAMGSTWALRDVRWNVSHSAEAGAAVDTVYRQVLNRAVDGGSQTFWQDAMGSTRALLEVRQNVSHSAEATDRIDDIYVQLLNRSINRANQAGVTFWQDRLNLTSFGNVRLEVAHTPEAQVDFDRAYYLQQNPDVASSGADPYLHFIDYGWKEGRNPDAFFSSTYYVQNNQDIAAAKLNPFLHYRTNGWHEGRDPSEQFSTLAYLDAYKDVAAAGIDPLSHFLTYGKNEGRLAFASGVNAVYVEKATIILDMNGQPFYYLPDNDVMANTARVAFRTASIASDSSAETKSTDFNVRQAVLGFAIQSAADSGKLFFIKSDGYPASLLLQAEGTGAVEEKDGGGTINGIYEYIIPLDRRLATGSPVITHARFIPKGYISGHPNNFSRSDGTYKYPPYGVI